MSQRQEQALRGLRLAELKLEERSKASKYTPPERSRYFAAGTVAWWVRDELPRRPQHGNGAKDGRSWSGTVPKARFMTGALRSLVRRDLVEEMPRFMWVDNQRSGLYRLTREGREAADDWLRRRAPTIPPAGAVPSAADGP